MRKIALLVLTSFSALLILAQETPLWMRYPSISPDGKTIVFSYKGDLYKVPAAAAMPIRSPCMKLTIICRYGAVMENGLLLQRTAMAILMCM